MVVVEVLARGGAGEYRVAATVTVEGSRVDVVDDGQPVELPASAMSVRRGRPVSAEEDAEEWARSLPAALRGPYLSARVVRDDQMQS